MMQTWNSYLIKDADVKQLEQLYLIKDADVKQLLDKGCRRGIAT
jgi:hypothetical protein